MRRDPQGTPPPGKPGRQERVGTFRSGPPNGVRAARCPSLLAPLRREMAERGHPEAAGGPYLGRQEGFRSS
jgi:hypothetical protein